MSPDRRTCITVVLCLISIVAFGATPIFDARVDYPITSPQDVSIADFDGDGMNEVAILGIADSSLSVFKSDSSGVPTLQNVFRTGITPSCVFRGDFNNDGKPDLAVTNANEASISVLINVGGGLFAPQLKYATGSSPYGICGADFNGDGKLDLAVANHYDNTVSVFRGNGDGTFNGGVTYTTLPSQGGPMGIAAGDFNSDGKPDLVVTNAGSYASIVILSNTGSGAFAPPVEYDLGGIYIYWGTNGVVVADFDGDGKPDIAVTSAAYNTALVAKNDGTGAFPASGVSAYPVGKSPATLAVTDLNGDGKPDLVVGCTLSAISCLTNKGDGTFAAADTYVAGLQSSFVAAGDLNGDGKPDVVSTDVGGSNFSVYLNKGTGSFVYPRRYPVGAYPMSICTADFDGDGILDMAVATPGVSPSWQGVVTIMKGNGDGTFRDSASYYAGARTISVVAGDFNGDGKPDLAVANSILTPVNVAILMNNGNGTFAAPVSYPLNATPSCLATADLNGDGKLDLAVSCNKKTSVLLNNGDGTFAPVVDYGNSGNLTSICIADLNRDGKPDLASANSSGAGGVLIWLNNGDGTFSSGGGYSTALTPKSVVSGDFNGDGYPDLAVVNFSASNVSILLNQGGTTFTGTSYWVPSKPMSACVADLDGDARPEVIVASYDENVLSLLRNYGNGTFTLETRYGAGYGTQAVTAADFNGDGKKDLAVANYKSNDFYVLLNKATQKSCCIGTTGNVDGDPSGMVDISDVMALVDYLTLSLPLSPCFAENDVNRDGHIDISDIFSLIDYLVFDLPLPLCP